MTPQRSHLADDVAAEVGEAERGLGAQAVRRPAELVGREVSRPR